MPTAVTHAFVCLNGRLIRSSAARVPITDPGFTHGEGVFETLLIRDGSVQLPREHFARLCRSARSLDLVVPLTSAAFIKAAAALIRHNRVEQGMLRIVLTPATLLLMTRPWPERPASARVTFVVTERCLPHLKTLNYLPTVLAQREAEKKGFDEALLVDRDNCVTEGGRTNIFYVQHGVLYTPPLGRALAGVTRAKILMIASRLGIPTCEKTTIPADIRAADEVFLTNAPMEIWPVTCVEKIKKPVGNVTRQLMEAYAKKYGSK